MLETEEACTTEQFLCKEGFEVVKCPLEESQQKNGPCKWESLCKSAEESSKGGKLYV